MELYSLRVYNTFSVRLSARVESYIIPVIVESMLSSLFSRTCSRSMIQRARMANHMINIYIRRCVCVRTHMLILMLWLFGFGSVKKCVCVSLQTHDAHIVTRCIYFTHLKSEFYSRRTNVNENMCRVLSYRIFQWYFTHRYDNMYILMFGWLECLVRIEFFRFMRLAPEHRPKNVSD